MAGPSSSVYNVNEKVLCYHGPFIYEAKALKVENWDETTTKLGSVGPHYLVHYRGWKQTYAPPNILVCLVRLRSDPFASV